MPNHPPNPWGDTDHTFSPSEAVAWMVAAITLVLLLLFLFSRAEGATFKCTHAQWEEGECWPQTEREFSGASDQEWYKTLMQPDTPPELGYPQSCCGVADAYYADEQEQAEDGSIIAIITDTRDDKRPIGNGLYVNRPHVPVGTKIKVPPSKLRKNPSFNPTDHTIIFLSSGHGVYCYEPATLM